MERTARSRGVQLAAVSDTSLVERTLDGDADAFREIVDRYSGRMRAYVSRIVGSLSEADDVVQVALLTSWRQLHTLRDPAALKSWLMRIASREAFVHLRRRPADIPLLGYDSATVDSPQPEQIAIRNAQLAALGRVAMTASDETASALPCGKTVRELAAYLEVGRTPIDPHIESCPECLNALDALERAGRLSRDLIDDEATRLPAPPESWFERIFTTIHEELRAGRSFPISHPDPRVHITVTEGAVRALLRDIGDSVDGAYITRTEIVGDAETLGAPVEINLAAASVRFGISIAQLTAELRHSAHAALATHTERVRETQARQGPTPRPTRPR